MKKLVLFLIVLLAFLLLPKPLFAADDPFSHPNNKFGIHILFPSELPEAAKLVNSNGGDWGYVTIPIQAGDKNLKKWQDFMDQAKALHLIPIIRLATEGDYFNTTSWRKPTYADVLDFANFLDSLNWPTKNRYIIVFNEVNRGDEWGGTPNPQEYANILSYAVTAFKSKSSDFFIISAGMDNAAANTDSSMNEYNYFEQMNASVPGIFNQIDGIASHAYPNPAFSQPPSVLTSMSIDSFSYERGLIAQMSNKTLPTFITETGWSRDNLSDSTIASYYQQAFQTVWNDPGIVAITPFLLRAGGGPFTQFSFLDVNGNPSLSYKAYQNISKPAGQPALASLILSASTVNVTPPIENFSHTHSPNLVAVVSSQTKSVIKWFLHL